MKKAAEDRIFNSQLTRSPLKSSNAIDPREREFDFELWATLVRSQMTAALRH